MTARDWRASAKRLLRSLDPLLPNGMRIRIERLRPASSCVQLPDRVSYQRRFVQFQVSPGERVLDLGSGSHPFPHANVLVDRFIERSVHRDRPLVTDAKPFVVADMARLPFGAKTFHYVYCSHALEHATDPIAVCREIIRVGRRGYIETPTLAKDMLFAWAQGMHKWHVIAIGQRLCFFEYSSRQLDGIRSSAWRDLILSPWWHPLQDAFDANQDLFNVMFTWSDSFSAVAYHIDGRVETLGRT